MIHALPKDLPETFNRALSRVLRGKKADIVAKIFQFVAAAKRPLSLPELREAVSVETCQKALSPDQLVNDIGHLRAWSASLIILDEEEELVQYAHHSVKDFLQSTSVDKSLDIFQFKFPDADDMVGQICVTYLNLENLGTELARPQR